MPKIQLPATTPKRRAWNKGRVIGQKRPLLPKQVWAIRKCSCSGVRSFSNEFDGSCQPRRRQKSGRSY